LLAYAQLAGRHLAGAWGGRLAVALIACEPILLAHASLATTDIAVTACLFALGFHYPNRRRTHLLRPTALPAFLFAATMLAKASGLVFGSICLIVVELEYLLSKTVERGAQSAECSALRALRSALRPVARDLAQIVAGGLLLTFLYCGSDWKADPSF